MDYTSKTGSGKEPPSLGSGGPSLTAIAPSQSGHQLKNPEDLLVLRVERATTRLAASAPVRAATVMAITPFLPTIAAMVITTVVAIVVVPFVTRGDIHDRRAARGGHIDHRRWAMHYGRRARRSINHDGTRGMKDWHGQPKVEADGNSCLSGAGQSNCCNHCYQTEQMLCFHGRSDGVVGVLFDSTPLIKAEAY